MKTTIRFVAVILVIALQIWSCTSTEPAGTQLANQAPTVWLAAAPPEGSIAAYTIHIWWGGWDPDGEIAYYEYVITNNESGIFDPADTTGADKWLPVFGNDSIFTFTADQVADSTDLGDNDGTHEPEEFRRSHTFFIRAVDDQGIRTAKPVHRSFTARTLSPTVFVDVPRATGLNPALVPPITTFSWTGKDYVSNIQQVQEPDSSRHILLSTKGFGEDWDATLLYIQTTPDDDRWSDWDYYRQPGDTGKFWTSPPLDLGPYIFAIQVKDEAGAVSPVFDLASNTRRVLVGQRATGPVFVAFNRFMGSIVTSTVNTPATILDLPVGVPMSFTLRASAEDYGGIVSGYRYGWDILDLNDDEQWAVDFTPFTGSEAVTPSRTFFFGSHTFFAEVIDNSGLKSRVEVRVNIIPFTMNRNLLFVDDWEEKSNGWAATTGALPSDGQHDLFWKSMLDSVEGFDSKADVFDISEVPGNAGLPITVVADYRNMIWSSQGNHSATSETFLSQVIRFNDPTRATSAGGRTVPNIAALFMSAGGHVLLCGEEVLTMAINRASFGAAPLVYPLIFRYELSGDQDGAYGDSDIGVRGIGDGSFAYNECCVNVLDIAFTQSPNAVRRPPNQQFPPGTGCPVLFIRDHGQTLGAGRRDGLRAAVPLDLTSGGGFPQLNLRPEVQGNPDDPDDADEFFYHRENTGLRCDIYNPLYFQEQTDCDGLTEYDDRTCFQPIFAMACDNDQSAIFGATVGFWTTQFEDRIPDVGGVPARSAVWGFHPVFFNPDEVWEALKIVLFSEWGLSQTPPLQE
jgi:hypothetical protein